MKQLFFFFFLMYSNPWTNHLVNERAQFCSKCSPSRVFSSSWLEGGFMVISVLQCIGRGKTKTVQGKCLFFYVKMPPNYASHSHPCPIVCNWITQLYQATTEDMQYDLQLGGQIPSFDFACLFFTDIWRYFQTDYSVSTIIPCFTSLFSPILCSFIFQVLLHSRMIKVGRVFLFRQRRLQEKPLKTNIHPTKNSQTVLCNKLINRSEWTASSNVVKRAWSDFNMAKCFLEGKYLSARPKANKNDLV